MSTSLPTPIRALLGLAAVAVEEARKIPETLPGAITSVPVEAISAAMQASMKVQQRIAVLASKGDELLSQLRGTPDDAPVWATFDDEQPAGDERPVAPFDRAPHPDEDDLAADGLPDVEDQLDGAPGGFDPDALSVQAAQSDSASTVRALADKAPANTAPSKAVRPKNAPAKKSTPEEPSAEAPSAEAPSAKRAAPGQLPAVKVSGAKKAPGAKKGPGPAASSLAAPPAAPSLATELGEGLRGPSVPAPPAGPAVPEPPAGPAVPPDA